MQIAERRQDLDDVSQRPVWRQWIVHAVVFSLAFLQQIGNGAARNVFQDDVAGALVRDEVVDLDDHWVFYLGEEFTLGLRGCGGVGVGFVQQPLQHHPAVGDVLIPSQVDPAHASVCEAADRFVLTRHQLTRRDHRTKIE